MLSRLLGPLGSGSLLLLGLLLGFLLGSKELSVLVRTVRRTHAIGKNLLRQATRSGIHGRLAEVLLLSLYYNATHLLHCQISVCFCRVVGKLNPELSLKFS